MKIIQRTFIIGALSLASISAFAKIEISLSLTNPSKGITKIGTVTAEDTSYGLLLTPNLKHLTRGTHGFHIHEHPSCSHVAKDAGSHYDPKNTGKHLGPYNDEGHLGDLPALIVNHNGSATLPVLAPRLHEKDLLGHALMIHAGGDNYADAPAPLGGGGDRIACGIISNDKS